MDFTLGSGAKLTVSVASFEIGNAIRKAAIKLGLENERIFIADDEMERLFFEAAKSAIYDGARVDRRLFDDPKLGETAKGDYHEMFTKVLEVNLAPFFPRVSGSSTQPVTKE